MTVYTDINFKTKKALKEAVAKGLKIEVFSPESWLGTTVPTNGKVSVCGPHYPEPHRWYANVTLQDGVIIKVA